jgi:hypothetical protein
MNKEKLPKDFGITARDNEGFWLIRFNALTEDGKLTTRSTSANYQAAGGKRKAKVIAYQKRDALYHHPDVKRFRAVRGYSPQGTRFMKSRTEAQKKYFRDLPGLTLVRINRAEGSVYFAVRYSVGSRTRSSNNPRGKYIQVSVSMQEYGVLGAVEKAAKAREDILGFKLYDASVITDNVNRFIKETKKDLVRGGYDISMGTIKG